MRRVYIGAAVGCLLCRVESLPCLRLPTVRSQVLRFAVRLRVPLRWNCGNQLPGFNF